MGKEEGFVAFQAVSVFFDSLAASKKLPEEMPPILKKLTGILKEGEASVKKYHDHLERKW